MFTDIYNYSLRFIGLTAQPLTDLISLLFTPLRELLVSAGLSDFITAFPDVFLYDLTIISIVLGSGLTFFLVYTLVKFFVGLFT